MKCWGIYIIFFFSFFVNRFDKKLNLKLCHKKKGKVWLLFAKSGSLWVAWHHQHHIKGKSFWYLPESAHLSWNWRCLLIRLRILVESFVKCNLGNSQLASFWFDSWSPFGPLIKFIGPDRPRDLQVPIQAFVASTFIHNQWLILAPRSAQVVALQSHFSSINLPLPSDEEDTYTWDIAGRSHPSFQIAPMWDALRPKQRIKDCSSFRKMLSQFHHVDLLAWQASN